MGSEHSRVRLTMNDEFERADHIEIVRENYEQLIDDDPERFVRIDDEGQFALTGEIVGPVANHEQFTSPIG